MIARTNTGEEMELVFALALGPIAAPLVKPEARKKLVEHHGIDYGEMTEHLDRVFLRKVDPVMRRVCAWINGRAVLTVIKVAFGLVGQPIGACDGLYFSEEYVVPWQRVVHRREGSEERKKRERSVINAEIIDAGAVGYTLLKLYPQYRDRIMSVIEEKGVVVRIGANMAQGWGEVLLFADPSKVENEFREAFERWRVREKVEEIKKAADRKIERPVFITKRV